jgi:hypothetical protein
MQWHQAVPVQHVHPHAVVVADHKARAVTAEGDAKGSVTARCAQRLRREGEVPPIEADHPIETGCDQPSIRGEGRAIALVTIGAITRHLRPASIAVKDAHAAPVEGRCEVAAVRREDEVNHDAGEITDGLQQRAGSAGDEIDHRGRARSGPPADRNHLPSRGDGDRIGLAHISGAGGQADGAL